METAYISNMGAQPFFYYNPDANQRQHGQFTTMPTGIPYFPHFVKSAHATGYTQYPAPDASMVFQHGFFPQQRMMTPLASPQPIYHRSAPVIERHSPYLSQLDTGCSPSTPPLSASGSARSSPPTSSALLPTPSNGSFGLPDAYTGFKHGLEDELLLGMLPHDNFMSPSPPLTPVFVYPAHEPSRMTRGASTHATGSLKQKSPLSPAQSPPSLSAVSQPEFSFCDPRDLTVHSPDFFTLSAPGTQLIQQDSLFPVTTTSALPQFAPPAPDFLGTTGLESCDTLFGFDFDTDFNNFSKPAVADDLYDLFRSHKRQRTDLVAFPSDEETFVNEDAFSEADEDNIASAWLLNPTDLEDSFRSDMSTMPTSGQHSPTTSLPEVDSDGDYNNSGAENGASPSVHNQGSPSNGETSTNYSDAMASGSDETGNGPHSVNRRGRKQSLTDDPSKTFICHLCSRRFRRQEHLKRHYRSLHTHDKPFKCTDCGKTFSRSDNLAQHQRTHGTGTIALELNGSGEEVHGLQQPGSPESDSDRMAQILYQAAQRLQASTTPESSTSGTEESEASLDAAAADKQAKKRKREE